MDRQPILVNDFNVYKEDDETPFDLFNLNLPEIVARDIDDFYKNKSQKGYIFFDQLGRYDNAFEFCRLSVPNIKYFLTTEIVCTQKTDCIILVKGWFCAKIWVNETFAGIHNCSDTKIILPFIKGVNRLVFETCNSTKISFLSCRISSVGYERKLGKTSLITENMEDKTDVVRFFNSDCDYIGKNKKNEFCFMALPYDYVNTDLNQTINIRLFKRYPRRVIKRYSCKFLEIVKIPITEFDYDRASEGNNLFFECNYITKSGEKAKFNMNIFLHSVNEFNAIVNNQAKDMLQTLDDNSRLYLEYLICTQDKYGINGLAGYFTGIMMNNFIKSLECGEDNGNKLYKPGPVTFYFKSKLDNTIFKIFLHLPSHYNKNKEYPLVINIIIGERRESNCLNYFNGQAIIADVWARGMTFGSYIGEAAFFEVLNEILSKYKIDKSRMFGMGYSNTSSAFLSLAGNYPDLFAGIFLISGSARIESLSNIINTNVLYVSSENDVQYKSSYLEIEKATEHMNNFSCDLAKKYCHYNLKHLRFNTMMISNILSINHEMFPKNIYFRTERNIHNKSYWVTIHSIEYGEKFALVKAKADKNTIDITVENATGLTIKIPPYTDTKNLTVIINEKTLQLSETYKDELDFYKSDNEYSLQDENNVTSETYKGLGLLYPYTRPLAIITDTSNNDLIDLARSFSSPSNNSYNPVIYIQYPVVNANEISESEKNRCWILLDNNFDNPLLKQIRDNCSIKTDKSGYEYFGKRFDGSYVIMQMTEHPYSSDEKNKVLYINTNDIRLLKSHLLLRRIVLPSYLYGLHPYWNNAALIFDGDRYSRVVEFGMGTEDIITGR